MSTENEEAPLNVLLITVDTLRADALGAYGQERFTSPNIDLLAKEGVLFAEAMASAPSTLPSHASIMTARYPYVHGARANAGYVLSNENETLAEILRGAGYRTGAEIAATVLNHGTQLDQGFDHYRDLSSGDVTRMTISVDPVKGTKKGVELDERSAADITKFGIEFLLENSGNPFFLWLHYFDPHAHYTAPKAYGDLIPDSPYHAEVRYVDSEIGRLMRQLKRLGLDDRTVVVITADHGEGLNEHEENTHASFVYQSTMHVPLIIWGATEKIPSDWRVESPVRTIDIAPTILDLLDLPALQNVQGKSLTALINSESLDLGLTSYGESIELHSMFGSSILRCLRLGDWKYIHKIQPELYDLSRDPGELHNLAGERPGKVKELSEALRSEIRSAPAKPGDAEVLIDDETIRQLQALGYASAGPSKELGDEVSLLEVEGPDPSLLAEDFQTFSTGWYYASITSHVKAVEVFEGLAKRHPRSPKILNSLGDSLIHLKRYEEAVKVFHRTIEADPENGRAHNLLGQSEEALGHLDEAEVASRRALELHACANGARLRLASILERTDRLFEQAEMLKTGIEACPNAYEVLNNYAYLLSTSPRKEIRDGKEAIRIAKVAVEKSGGTRPAILDTLAGAYAEAGDFMEAVRVSRHAIVLAREKGMPSYLIEALEKNRARFERETPSRKE